MSGTVVYVYALARGIPDVAVFGLAGIDGGPVRLVTADGLQAVVSDVDRSGFEGRALEERREDLQWLATTARAHHNVVDTLGQAHPVAPLSLATVYYGDERVRAVVTEGAEAVGRLLDLLDGRAEWGVKAWVRPPAAAAAARPRSGAEYLRARRRALREGDSSVEQAQVAAADLHAALDAVAADSRTHRPQEAALSGRGERMVLNGAYLVGAGGAAALAAAVDTRADRERLHVEVTGPWVPYSFAQVDVS